MKDDDRDTKAYRDGYASGQTWDADWNPGGPLYFSARDSDPEWFKVHCKEMQDANRQWLLGWTEGNAVNPDKPITRFLYSKRKTSDKIL